MFSLSGFAPSHAHARLPQNPEKFFKLMKIFSGLFFTPARSPREDPRRGFLFSRSCTQNAGIFLAPCCIAQPHPKHPLAGAFPLHPPEAHVACRSLNIGAESPTCDVVESRPDFVATFASNRSNEQGTDAATMPGVAQGASAAHQSAARHRACRHRVSSSSVSKPKRAISLYPKAYHAFPLNPPRAPSTA